MNSVLFERFDDKGLSQYSYAVGCRSCGAIAIVDPRRDVDVYVDFAAAREVKIAYVLETHIHADFASGARELAERTGARHLVSRFDRGEQYEARFSHEDLDDGQAITLGTARIVARHTPGHTPEHLSFLVYDTARSDRVPQMMLAGDFLFIGSLGRPDLLGEDAKRALAAKQYESVQKLAELPDGLEIHPGHGSGSMCGAGMSDRPMSTLGFERVANPYLRKGMDRESFVETLLKNVPPFPPYYRRMKKLNSDGPPILGLMPGGRRLSVEEVRAHLDKGAVAIDLRDQLGFGGGHIPGAFGIGAGQNLSTWASWVVPYDTPIVLVDEDEDELRLDEAARSLVRVGLDGVEGHLAGGMRAWREARLAESRLPQLAPWELHERVARGERFHIVDVRGDGEWRGGHIAGATHVMGGFLGDHLAELRETSDPIALVCGGGYRSTVAASILERAGVSPVFNVTGGMTAWKAAGLPVIS